jgi:hypothetical protein
LASAGSAADGVAVQPSARSSTDDVAVLACEGSSADVDEGVELDSLSVDDDAGLVSEGGGVLGASTDQPSASPAIRPIVSSLRERLVDDGAAARARWFAASVDQPSVRLVVRAASAVATFACEAEASFRVMPGGGVVRDGGDADVPRAAGVGAGGGVLGTSTDQPSARPAIRSIVSSLRGGDEGRTSSVELADSRVVTGFGVARGTLPAVGVRMRPLVSPDVGVRMRPLVSPDSGVRMCPLASPDVGVRMRPLASPELGVRMRPLASAAVAPDRDCVRPLASPDGDRMRPLASPVAVRAGSIDAGGESRDVGPDREGAGVAAGVAAAGGSSLGDSTDQPDARSAIRLLVSSPSRRRVRSSSGTGRP